MSVVMLLGAVVGMGLLASPGVPEPAPPEEVEAASPPAEEEPAPTDAADPPATPEEDTVEPTPSAEDAAPPEAEPSAPPLHTFDPMDSPPSPAALDDEVAPLPADDEGDPTAPSDAYRRRGFLITLGAGLTHCAQDFCTPIRMGGLGRLELGYRLTRVAFVATVTGGGGRTDSPTANETAIRTFDVAAGVLLLPVREGPVDPFLGASLGYARTIRVLDEDSSNDRQLTKRGALRLSGGILWHVTPRLALGPRFDARLPFAGSWCTVPSVDGVEQCQSIREEIIDVDDPDKGKESKRSDRRAFPRPWALTLDLRITI